MEKTHTISSVTPLIDENGKWYWCKVRAKRNDKPEYWQGRTYSIWEMKTKFNIETAEACKNLLNKPCKVIYDLEF